MPGNPARDRLARAAVSSPPLGRSGGRPEIDADRIVCVTMRSLALSNYLMFDHAMRWSASEKNYGDYCHVQ